MLIFFFNVIVFLIIILIFFNLQNSTVKLFVSMNVGVFSLILLLTHFLATDSTRILILGWICVAVSVSVFAAPLSIVVSTIN